MAKEDTGPEPARRAVQRNGTQRQDEPRRRRQVSDDPFYINPAEIPSGSTWEWKRATIMGQPDQENQISAKEAGWLPVTWGMRLSSKRPPGLTELGLDEPVFRKGMMLMERPVELTREARTEDSQRASQQVLDKFRELGQAPAETLPRDHPNLRNRVTREYAPASGLDVPDDNADAG